MTFDLEHPLSVDFLVVNRATATFVMIFNGRRGGKPVRLRTYQWEEALNDEWLEKIEYNAVDMPEEYDNSMLITYMTGKGNHHLDERCDFHDFGLFFGNFGPNLANFIPQVTINNVKLVYYYDPMSRLGICSHSYQMEMGMDHLSDERCDFHDFGLFFCNFGPNLA